MNPSESKAREALTRQQRNLALAQPIARLSLDRRVIFKDEPALSERLDVQYLALSAIDFVMERSAIESGASPEEIVDHVASEAARIKPTLTEEQGRKVGQTVLDHLANAREGHKAFRVEYYDPDRGGFSFHDFRLLALSTAADGSPRFKLATGAQTLALAMLDVAPEFAQERHRAGANLVDQGRQAEIDPLARVAVALPVKRLVLAVLLEDDRRQKVETRRRRCSATRGTALAIIRSSICAASPTSCKPMPTPDTTGSMSRVDPPRR